MISGKTSTGTATLPPNEAAEEEREEGGEEGVMPAERTRAATEADEVRSSSPVASTGAEAELDKIAFGTVALMMADEDAPSLTVREVECS